MAENRPRGLSRIPDFGSAEDRLIGAAVVAVPEVAPVTRGGEAKGSSGARGAAQAEEARAARRRPLKVHESLADQLRDAVLFLRGRGRPELTQNELLDEIIQQGLDQLSKDLNDGQAFPASTRRRVAGRR